MFAFYTHYYMSKRTIDHYLFICDQDDEGNSIIYYEDSIKELVDSLMEGLKRKVMKSLGGALRFYAFKNA